EVTLHVEDELALRADRGLRELQIKRRLARQIEEAAAHGVGVVEREQRARRAARGNQKLSPREAQALCPLGGRLMGEAIAHEVLSRKRHGRKLTVRRRVDLDRKSLALGINAGIVHFSAP